MLYIHLPKYEAIHSPKAILIRHKQQDTNQQYKSISTMIHSPKKDNGAPQLWAKTNLKGTLLQIQQNEQSVKNLTYTA